MVRNVGGKPRPFGDDKKKKIKDSKIWSNNASSKPSVIKGRLKTGDLGVEVGEGNYLADPLICDGCGKEFLKTLRNEDDPSNRTYCQTCASRVIPMNEMLELEKSLPERVKRMWRTPVDDLVDELTIKDIEGMRFVDRGMNKRLIEMKMKKNRDRDIKEEMELQAWESKQRGGEPLSEEEMLGYDNSWSKSNKKNDRI